MMTKRKSPMRNRLKYLIVLPFLFLVVLVVCCNKSKKLAPPPPPPPPPAVSSTTQAADEAPFPKVDQPAQFQGGDIDNFRAWVQKNVVYPPDAIKKGIFGRVTVHFVVDSNGKISFIEVLRSPDPILEIAAVNVIWKAPEWIPAKSGGKNVKQQFVIPVEFALK